MWDFAVFAASIKQFSYHYRFSKRSNQHGYNKMISEVDVTLQILGGGKKLYQCNHMHEDGVQVCVNVYDSINCMKMLFVHV